MSRVTITEAEVEFKAIRASGPGGQHVNKASTAAQLRFDSQRSRLSDEMKARILGYQDRRISRDGMITITARRYRSQDANRQDALDRLNSLLQKISHRQKPRKATRPTRASVQKRLDAKTRHGQKKKMRGRVNPE